MGSYGTERSSGVFGRALVTCSINVKVKFLFNFIRKIILPMTYGVFWLGETLRFRSVSKDALYQVQNYLKEFFKLYLE